MKPPRRKKPSTPRRQREKRDPVTEFMEAALQEGEYRAFHCVTHGKFLSKPEGRAICPVCNEPCFTPEEWVYQEKKSLRERRLERVSKLRNHLE